MKLSLSYWISIDKNFPYSYYRKFLVYLDFCSAFWEKESNIYSVEMTGMITRKKRTHMLLQNNKLHQQEHWVDWPITSWRGRQ